MPCSQGSPIKRHHVGGSRLLGIVLACLLLCAGGARADDAIDADTIVGHINAAPEGDFVTRRMTMEMTDRRGRTRTRDTISYRKNYAGERRSVLFYTAPANIRDTGFLVFDYDDAAHEDDQWLYLPALRKVRRIPAADRGDYFLGTDLTYDDIKLDGRVGADDYAFRLLGHEAVEGVVHYRLEGLPRSEVIAAELGYARVEFLVDGSNWMILRSDFAGTDGEPLKTIEAADIRQIDGIWTRHNVTVSNHRTGHTTRFLFTDVDYQSPIDDGLFTQRALSRGQ